MQPFTRGLLFFLVGLSEMILFSVYWLMWAGWYDINVPIWLKCYLVVGLAAGFMFICYGFRPRKGILQSAICLVFFTIGFPIARELYHFIF